MNISIVGAVGVPARYGGFETLVENLVRTHESSGRNDVITVYCSSKSYEYRLKRYHSARLKYIPISANGVSSIFYDAVGLWRAVVDRSDAVLILGVSGAIMLPFIRPFSSAKIVTNIDGLEWLRPKWKGLARLFLRFSEMLAVKFSDHVIADNQAIANYVMQTYGVDCKIIAYGGDHAVAAIPMPLDELVLPARYAFAVCRIEPENNVHMIVEAFVRQSDVELVMVGNWDSSDYGWRIRADSEKYPHIHLIDPIYNLGKLKTLRSSCLFYVHGHSAGGTNPSLVEAMHFGKPIVAFECAFNRATMKNRGNFFSTSDQLREFVQNWDKYLSAENEKALLDIAQAQYRWEFISQEYFALLHDKRN